MEDIHIRNLSKSFQNKQVLRRLTVTLPSNAVSCLMAPSGAGKTTLLRILCGLEKADEGEIIGLKDARFAFVFQEDRLCESLDAAGNIRLTNPRLPTGEVVKALSKFGIDRPTAWPVREFSGGMRRRVALLRALMARWDVLLMDEPFSGLDDETKDLVIEETKALTADRTVILVTHDESEAAAMGAAIYDLLALQE